MARMSILTLITAPAMLVMTTFVSNASVHTVGKLRYRSQSRLGMRITHFRFRCVL
jgi:hypothetical protein